MIYTSLLSRAYEHEIIVSCFDFVALSAHQCILHIVEKVSLPGVDTCPPDHLRSQDAIK